MSSLPQYRQQFTDSPQPNTHAAPSIPYPLAHYPGLAAVLGDDAARLLVYCLYWQSRASIIGFDGRAYRWDTREGLRAAVMTNKSLRTLARHLAALQDLGLLIVSYDRANHRLLMSVDLEAVAALEPAARAEFTDRGGRWHPSYFPDLGLGRESVSANTCNNGTCPPRQRNSNNTRGIIQAFTTQETLSVTPLEPQIASPEPAPARERVCLTAKDQEPDPERAARAVRQETVTDPDFEPGELAWLQSWLQRDGSRYRVGDAEAWARGCMRKHRRRDELPWAADWQRELDRRADPPGQATRASWHPPVWPTRSAR